MNTFRDAKYNALPGDLNAATASQFGFAARGALPGQQVTAAIASYRVAPAWAIRRAVEKPPCCGWI